MCLLLITSILVTEFRHMNLGEQILTMLPYILCYTYVLMSLINKAVWEAQQ